MITKNNGDIRSFRDGEHKRIGSGERPVQHARRELTSLFDDLGDPEDTGHGLGSLTSLETPPQPLYQEREELTPDFIRKVRQLIQEQTLQSHRKAATMLERSKLNALSRWQDLHTKSEGRHRFSEYNPALANNFVRSVVEWVPDDWDTRVLELGMGFGNDLAAMAGMLKKARFIGVDSSQAAVDEAREQFRVLGLLDRVQLKCGNYMDVLDDLKDSRQSLVYSNSSLHYFPALMLRDVVIPKVARVLRNPGPAERQGKFLFGLKTAVSDSATAPDKFRLLENDMYTHCFDVWDGVFRLYPQRMKDVVRLIHSDFTVNHAYLEKVEDYDHKGDTEEFCYVAATARRWRGKK